MVEVSTIGKIKNLYFCILYNFFADCQAFLKNIIINLATHFVTCKEMEFSYMTLKNNERKTIDVTDDIIKS